jgi:hypothetical protein
MINSNISNIAIFAASNLNLGIVLPNDRIENIITCESSFLVV